jgi:DNA adenine methylase
MTDIPKKARPFLKWAGGKTRLLPELRKRVPSSYGTYYEPFLGGGSMFFDLAPARAVLSDANLDLVRTYIAVRDDVDGLIDRLLAHARDHALSGKDHYTMVRFLDPRRMTDVNCGARMIYLNKTCFNGLWRVNKSGLFNVPMGKFKTPPTICDEDNLRLCSAALKGKVIDYLRWEEIEQRVDYGDFVYFDPPYVPVSTTANFTGYTKDRFGPDDQKRLAHLAIRLHRNGAHVLVSNSGTPEVADLYGKGFKISTVRMRRNINCSAGKRGEVNEYLIS